MFCLCHDQRRLGYIDYVRVGVQADRELVQGQGIPPPLVSKICNVNDLKILVVDCTSLTLGWISLSLYKVVVIFVYSTTSDSVFRVFPVNFKMLSFPSCL